MPNSLYARNFKDVLDFQTYKKKFDFHCLEISYD